MRKDMAKVICETRRYGGRGEQHNIYRRAKHFRLDDDFEMIDDEFGPHAKSMKRSRLREDTKSFGENLTPLYRFIASKVGKSWDKTYSEIKDGLSTDSTLHDHILIHVDGFVETNTYVGDDGEIYCTPRYWSGPQLAKDLINTFYVNPKNGVLMKSRFQSYEQRNKAFNKGKSKEQTEKVSESSENIIFRKEKGIWYRIDRIKIPSGNDVDAIVNKITSVCPNVYTNYSYTEVGCETKRRVHYVRDIHGVRYEFTDKGLERDRWVWGEPEYKRIARFIDYSKKQCSHSELKAENLKND